MLITRSPFSLPTNMDIEKNICLFMPMIFTLIEMKFHIDINNGELLIITWEKNKEENCHS